MQVRKLFFRLLLLLPLQEVRDKQRYNWFEKVVHDFAGEQLSSEYLRSRKEPKM